MKKNKPFLGTVKHETPKDELKKNLNSGITKSLLEKYKPSNVLLRLDNTKNKVKEKIAS
tara:strand:+ start:71 stop:247 length:177 start_codon:yes stop_codon:yes gene_type:complete